MQLAQGTLLQGGKYKIEKVLGQGSFGITYLAEHTALGKKVCIKEFFMKELNSRSEDGSITGLSDGSLSYNYAQKFRKEAQNLARMEHPNIVRVTDCFDENATFYYVMEYIEGQDLNTYIKQHALSEAEAVAIIKDVANALIYMHDEKHMLHLDLKPGNVMRRNSDGHIFLIDFGLSKHYDTSGTPETSTTIGLGTAGYAPIEQANQAKNGEFRPTIDVYALGATLYKLLTGQTPPVASNLVSDDELLLVSMKEKNISESLINVVVNATLPNVRKRIQSISDFKMMLSSSAPSSSILPSTYSNSQEETMFVSENSHVNMQKENVSNVIHGTNTPKEASATAKKGNNSLKFIIAAVVLCAIGVGSYFVMVPSNIDKFGEAYRLFYGEGIEEDKEAAMLVFNELAEKDYGPAIYMLGHNVLPGSDNNIMDSTSAFNYFERAMKFLPKESEKGDLYAQYLLGECYANGYAVESDIKKAFDLYMKSADQGMTWAMASAAFLQVFEDTGIPQNKKKAEELLKKAAELGNKHEQYNLAFFYQEGLLGKADTAQAVVWYTKAAEQGECSAMLNLGNYYRDGTYVKQDYKKAISYYKSAADKDDVGGLFQLALMYFFGRGVTEDHAKVITYLNKAIEIEDFPDAHLVLAYCYMDKQPDQCFKHMKIAAEADMPEAQYQLACLYQQGNGVKANQKVAEQWYRKAIANGYQE